MIFFRFLRVEVLTKIAKSDKINKVRNLLDEIIFVVFFWGLYEKS